MVEPVRKKRKKIFWILIVVSVLVGYLIYGAMHDEFGLRFLYSFPECHFICSWSVVLDCCGQRSNQREMRYTSATPCW